ncbi:MAG: hypothetical protein ACREVO_00315 [Steroidobacteraceae bacterium]
MIAQTVDRSFAKGVKSAVRAAAAQAAQAADVSATYGCVDWYHYPAPAIDEARDAERLEQVKLGYVHRRIDDQLGRSRRVDLQGAPADRDDAPP